MPADKIHLGHAKEDKLFYFIANVVIYREKDSRCLILKRHHREKVHPEKYAVPGGKLEWQNLDISKPTRVNGDVLDFQYVVEDLLRRETLEEAGIQIKEPLHYLNSVAFIRPDGIPAILVKFAARYSKGTIELEQGAFTDHQWVNEDEIDKFECIEGIAQEVKDTIKLFTQTSKG